MPEAVVKALKAGHHEAADFLSSLKFEREKLPNLILAQLVGNADRLPLEPNGFSNWVASHADPAVRIDWLFENLLDQSIRAGNLQVSLSHGMLAETHFSLQVVQRIPHQYHESIDEEALMAVAVSGHVELLRFIRETLGELFGQGMRGYLLCSAVESGVPEAVNYILAEYEGGFELNQNEEFDEEVLLSVTVKGTD